MADLSMKLLAGDKFCQRCNTKVEQGSQVTCPQCGGQLSLYSDDVLIGTTIGGNYKIEALIGKGPSSRIYRAIHLQIQTPVAVKILKSTGGINSRQMSRFQSEARMVFELSHPNIARVYDFGASPEPYIVMELVKGPNLSKKINDDGPLDWRQAVDIFIGITNGLEAAHSAGLIHRDLKPSNVLLDVVSGEAKIADFGLVKSFVDDVKLTKTGEMVGSPAYMSPEQCRGERLDARSDIYSLGCLMYELLTGEQAFAGASTIEVMFKHLEADSPDLQKSMRGRACPKGLNAIIARTLAKQVEDRYQNVAELRRDLELIKSGRNVKTKRKPRGLGAKIRSYLLMTAAIAATVVIGIVYMAWGYIQGALPDSYPQPIPVSNISEGVAKYLDAYCLKPDQRFVDALTDVAEFTDSASPAVQHKVTTKLEAPGWQVLLDGKPIGQVSRNADRTELLAVLDKFATMQVSKSKMKSGSGSAKRIPLTVSGLLSDLQSLDTALLKQSLDGVSASRAARDLSWLSVVGYDRLDGLDKIQARALAFSAIANALHKDDPETRVLLDWDMGYRKNADIQAQKLPAESPLRAYLLNDFGKLTQLAGEHPGDSEAAYLSLLAETNFGEESKKLGSLPGSVWDSKAPEDKDLALAKLDMRSKDYIWNNMFAQEMILVAVNSALDKAAAQGVFGGQCNYDEAVRKHLADVKGAPKPGGSASYKFLLDKEVGEQVAHFNRMLPAALKNAHGRIVSPDLARAFYESFFYSALYDIYKHLRDDSDQKTAFLFVDGMGSNLAGTKVGALQQSFYRGLNTEKLPVYFAALRDTKGLGAPIVWQDYYSLRAADKFVRNGYEAARVMVGSLDNRPQNLEKFADLAHNHLNDAWLSQSFHRQSANESSDVNAVWSDFRDGKMDRVKSFVRDEKQKSSDRAQALKYLVMTKAIDEKEHEAILEKIATGSDDRDALIEYGDFLCEQGRPQMALSLMQGWLARHKDAAGLEPAIARSSLARYAFKAGQKDLALSEAKEAAESGQKNSLLTYGDLLRENGQLKLAEEQYKKADDRYQDTQSFSRMVGIAWRLDEPVRAADMVGKHDGFYGAQGWVRYVGPEFIAAYENNPYKGKIAFQALFDRFKAPWGWFDGIPLAFMNKKDYKNGFTYMSKMFSATPLLDGNYAVLAYRCLRETGEKAAADAWLKRRVAESPILSKNSIYYAVPALNMHQYDILWDVVPLSPAGEKSAVWDLRAAAELAQPGLAGKYHDLLEREVAKDPKCIAGKYFLGQLTDRDLDTMPLKNDAVLARTLCYARAWKSTVCGDLADAAKWYGAALNIGPQDFTRDFRDYRINRSLRFGQAYVDSCKSLERMNADELNGID